ncbi:DUF6159 family protein [uncultured Jatrophihabitans sp.]|uniref:DUF6159 family protein n=1 Tax=uncultured Jatrophihabitans sp. TaxID=1610747 RepID=UPI0035CBF203
MADLSKPSSPGEFDPYRYGAPEPVAPVGRTSPTGKQILTASWAMLKRDRELIAVPVIGTVASVVAFGVLFVPGLILGLGSGHENRFPLYLFAILGGFVASVIGIFFQSALVIGAYQRADGQDPTLQGVLAAAWQMRRQILQWAVFTTIVGTIIRAVEQRLGLVGRILGFLGGIAWAVASFFAIPVIIAEGVGPIEAVKRSSNVIKGIWGTSVRTTLRFGAITIVLTIIPSVLLVSGVIVATSDAATGSGGVAGGVVLAAIGALILIAMSIVFGAIATYARALIYRWATGRPVPGIDPSLFAGAFRAKKRRRG